MGLRIWADESKGGPPFEMYITVTCDRNHGFFDDAPEATFPIGKRHPRDPVVAAGWKIDANGPVYCPACK